MSFQISPDFDYRLHQECGGDTGWVGGYLHGAWEVFFWLALATAIKESFTCDLCGSWQPRHHRPYDFIPCQCWNDD